MKEMGCKRVCGVVGRIECVSGSCGKTFGGERDSRIAHSKGACRHNRRLSMKTVGELKWDIPGYARLCVFEEISIRPNGSFIKLMIVPSTGENI